jgi:PAS domain S-box-containing protein
LRVQYSPYILPLIAAAVASGWVAVYAWINRRTSGGAMALSGLSLAIALWASAYALEIAGADLPTMVWGGKLQYVGIAAVPPLWLIFAINHTYQSRRVPTHTAMLLAIVPLLTIALTFTNEAHGLLWQEVGVYTSAATPPLGRFTALDTVHGFWFWVHSAYSYSLMLGGTALIVRSLGRMRGMYRGQALALLVGVAAPWVANALYLLGLSPIPHLDITPFAFTLTIIAMAWGIFGVHLIDMAPLARDVVVDEMQDAMIVLDVEGRIADMNPAAARLIGQEADLTLGKTVVETFSAWPRVIEKYREVVQDDDALRPQDVEKPERAMDEIVIGEGETQRWYEVRLLPLKNRRQRFIGRALTIRDVTNRRRLDEQLRQLSRAVEASPVSIVITDVDGLIEYVNPKFTQVTGYTFAEALGQNPRILKTEETPPEVHDELWETLTQGREWRGEFCNRKKNGEIYWEFASISPITDASGAITHYVAVKEDITERKQAEADLRRYTEELEASNAELDAFAHTVAHDLKNPLTTLLGFSLLMESHYDKLSPDRIMRNIQIITRTGQKMNNIIDELLLLASVRQVEDVTTRPLDMAAIVDEAMERMEGMIAEHEATVARPDDWPAAIGYPAWVEEVWINYISNALKYGGRPEEDIPPRVTLGWGADAGADGAQVRFWVQDNGPGLHEEERRQLFTQFTRMHETRAQGHGLGLSIVQRIVTKLEGTVGVESQPGEGSRFYFTLPSGEAAEDQAAPTE